MNVVDSSGWLEFFGNGPNADAFVAPIKAMNELIVPSITLYEVYKVMNRQRGVQFALRATSAMRRGTVIDLTTDLAIASAEVSLGNSLPMADSIILATARAYDATLWTQDADFAKIPGVKYIARRESP